MSTKEEPGVPQEKKEEEQINLRVANSDGSEVYFKIKKTTPLKKLCDAFCQRQGINPNSVRFLFEGQRINPDRTPKDYNMENEDQLDCAIEQQGGSF
ncbi:small ubiquitin-like protein [Cavenderia fasciculata]|uniref:Small ubiquitin-like protein n=1 Tax=Cavenderia fasciculata TaxID=261658 RepID=F4QBV4_CACFS|nr:small ubiquitin-like protein [Cavenderia fasciculata]EGG14692.1 small ubiquitin-like protein [Cavenderia fasciculata]|eukprot:XP_004351200.1 small ubiquitin-like protein [Cavenderia fasciculata]